jgi:hypothetical protein
MIDRGGNVERIGKRLPSLSNRLLRCWQNARDVTLSWSAVQERMRRSRREVKHTLLEGSRCSCEKVAAKSYEHHMMEEGLWSFARVVGGPAVGQALKMGNPIRLRNVSLARSATAPS